MFKRWRIRTKILAAFLIIAVVAVGTIAFFAFTTGQSTLEEESFNKLTAVREMKAGQIEDYFRFIEGQVTTLSEDRMIIEAMRAFDEGLHGMEGELSITSADQERIDANLRKYYEDTFLPRLEQLSGEEADVGDYWPEDERSRLVQALYLSENPFELGSKHLLSNAGDGSAYSQAHAIYHPIIRDYLEEFGYYDIFLVDDETGGHIVYSVFKEIDFGTSLKSGPHTNSNIGDVYRKVLESLERNAVALVDFNPYAPSYNAPAAFIGSAIFDGDERIGVLIFQMPIDRINAIMTNNQDWESVGLGESGETYLVGNDFTLRNQSRFLIEDSENYFALIEEIGTPIEVIDKIRNLNTTIGLQHVRTEGTRAAIGGETGQDIFPDYRGVPVLSAYSPINIEGLTWVIMSEIDESEAFASIRSLGIRLGIASVALIVFIFVAATFFSRSITRPIENLRSQASEISAGDLEVEIAVDTEDEINDLANVLDDMRLSNKRLIDDLADINQNLESLVAERTADLEASEHQSNSIVELAQDAIVVIDVESQVIVWNSAAERMFGYSKEEMIGSRIDPIVGRQYLDRHKKALALAQETKTLKAPGVTHVLTAQHKDGREFPIELSLSAWELRDEAFSSASIRDISERKQAEEALQNSEERLKFALEGSNDGLWDWNPQNNALFFSPRWAAMLGYETGELVPEIGTWEQMVHPDDLDRVNGIMAEHLAGNSPSYEAEYRMRSKAGEWIWILARGKVAIYDDDGKPIRFVGTHVDITERKRLEADIANQLSFIRTLVNTIPNQMFAMNDDQHYTLFNQAYQEAYDVSADDRIGKTVMDIEELPLELRQDFYEQNETLLKEGGMIHAEHEVPFADGKLHSVLSWVTSFNQADGSIGGLVGITTDITEQKELERLLEAANERMSTELNFAREIQMSMLPLIFPAFPNRKEVSIYAALEPAREVGGDFYDFYFIDDDHLAFVVGDVAGKGAPGALMMAVSKTLVKSRAADDSEPASILTHVNDELSRDNKSSMFVTVFMGIINVKTGEFVYTNAGHNPPYIKRIDGTVQKIDAYHGPVVGAMPGMPYQQDVAVLQEGEIVLLYTDGVTEAFNEKDELYSNERLEELLEIDTINSAEGIINKAVQSVQSFQGEAEQSDDITLLAIEFMGRAKASKEQEITITIRNQYEEMETVAARFAEFAETNELPDEVRQSINVVLDELLSNVITYAYQGDQENSIDVEIELAGGRLVVTVRDTGVPFNPFAQEEPDTSDSVEDRQIGGLGIHLVRSMMDEFSYQRQINKNVVTVVKYVKEDGEPPDD